MPLEERTGTPKATVARFICVKDDTGTFAVWDSIAGQAATLGGDELTGRDERNAVAACRILNRIFQNRLQRDATHPLPPQVELERIGDDLCLVIRVDEQRHRCIVGRVDDETLELAARSISGALIGRWLPDDGESRA